MMHGTLRTTTGVLTLLLLVSQLLSHQVVADGPEARKYAFTQPPLAIFDQAKKLGIGSDVQIPESERDFLEETWAKRSVESSSSYSEKMVVDAMLRASGVASEQDRSSLSEQFEQFADKAEAEISNCKSDYERGEKLVAFVHNQIMSKGYIEDQTRFDEVLKSGNFNCVSATAMIYLIGQHAKLQLRPLLISGNQWTSGHATLDMFVDEKWLEVEATNPDGFDWAKKMSQPGVFHIGFIPDRNAGVHSDGLGVAALIYSNRGTAIPKDASNAFLESIRLYASALALDPQSDSVTNNLISVLQNHCIELNQSKEFEKAIALAKLGIEVAPEVHDLWSVQRQAWVEYIMDTLRSGDDQSAMELVRRAHERILDDRDFESPYEWFRRLAYEQIDSTGWDEALAVADRGMAITCNEDFDGMLKLRTHLYRLWSQHLLSAKDAEGSMKVLIRAHEATSGDPEILAAIDYHAQEALGFLAEQELLAATNHYAELAMHFEDCERIQNMAYSFAIGYLNEVARQKGHSAAIQQLDGLREMLNAENFSKVTANAYARWAGTFVEAKDWEHAVETIVNGTKAFPDNKELLEEVASVFDQWAKSHFDSKDWQSAIRIYQQGLAIAPNHWLLKANLDYCVSLAN